MCASSSVSCLLSHCEVSCAVYISLVTFHVWLKKIIVRWRVSNRILRWTRHGLEYELDQRHVEKIVCDPGMEKEREVSTPCVQEGATNPDADDGRKGFLQPPDATKFRSIAARINYLAADRPDLQFASKCASKYMANLKA